MSAALSWLLFEGIPPLFGAALLYWALIACLSIVQSTSQFDFTWHEAIDSTGWLYGAAVLAIQSTVKGLGSPSTGAIPFFCGAIALVCFLLLISAMFAKAADSDWRPGRRMKWGATVITVAVLAAGYKIQDLICCIQEAANV